jgi:hypothetical protein
VLYGYAITEGSPRLDGVVGLGGRPTRAVRGSRLSLVASELAKPTLTEDDLWAHESVVEALMDAGPVLPMRAGTFLEGEGAARDLLARRGAELEAGLDRVRGAVELGLRAVVAEEPESEGAEGAVSSGAAYMEAKLARARREREVAGRLHEPLAAIARSSFLRVLPTKPAQVRAGYLVASESVEFFRHRVAELDEVPGASAIAVSGPWPPYSFVPERDG